ncbi:MAG: phosphoenolpyruvate synthase [Patescibacteria group bacterium]
MGIKNNHFILWFNQIDKEDLVLAGGKGANLGELTQANFPIPFGFVLSSQAYFYFIENSKLKTLIKKNLENINYENPIELKETSKNIRQLILKAEIPEKIIKEVSDAYHNILIMENRYLTKKNSFLANLTAKIKTIYKNPYVAVRSSATAEDLPHASFAGQQETFLNIAGENNLIQTIKRCWASLFTERAIYYRHQMNFDHFKVGLAAVVQRMVNSEKSGIAFSIDPIDNDKNKIIIEAIFGLGEYIVSGKVNPDHYEVNKKSLLILKKEIKFQDQMLIKKGGKNVNIKLNKAFGSQPKLTDEEIIKIALLVKDIEWHYFFPQDIEWAIENNQVFIVQSRPVTTIKDQGEIPKGKIAKNQPILMGNPASPGIAVGPVKIIKSPNEINKIKKGDILVAPQTNPDYVPAMKKAAGIVTEHGGRTSHAAIVSRELGIPAIVGAHDAIKILKDEKIITINGSTGEIFRGKVILLKNQESKKAVKIIKTITKVYVNLAEPDRAEEVSKMNVDGVGLLRAEFIMAQIGIHPKEFIKKNKEYVFINHLKNNLLKFVKAFNPRPVIYRATDFKTNEYRNLLGGKNYEPHEENPMLGFRGASRYINQPDVFKMELEAVKKIWQLGYKNLHLMIPFVRLPWEIIKIKELVDQTGLTLFNDFKLWIMVEVPYCALNIDDFLKVGIDGVSIGTNDLSMMLLGVDRDNELISYIYDERYSGIIKIIQNVIERCLKHNVTVSICGQAVTDYQDILEPLVKAGITSVSVNPDAIERTRETIYQLEKKFVKR